MVPYANRNGNSGAIAYEIGVDSITVRFGEGTYLYDYNRPGRVHCEEMSRLARAGRGLATCISQFVGDNYAAKLA